MRYVSFLLIATTVATCAIAATVPSQQVDQLFAPYDRPNSPGCSVGIIRDGKFVYRKSYGEASLELGVPLTSQSVFYMASLSKQFTAASVVLAAEEVFLSLDDDVRKYIPELPDYGHRITLRQMLHQTSGFRDFFTLFYLSGSDDSNLSSPERVLKLITRQKGLNNTPGASFVYSNSNYFLLALVVKRATGKSLAEFAAQHIFQPLGMTHTLFYDDNKIVVPARVAAYDSANDATFHVDWSTTFDIVGSGGLMSSVDDLLAWDNDFYADKLGKGTVIRQLESHGRLNNGHEINYGMGLWLAPYRGLPTVAHSGGTLGYRTELLRFPQQHFSVIALCNLASVEVEGLARKISDLYLSDQFQSISPEASQQFPDPTPFAGKYLDPRTHTVYTFTVRDGKLMAWGVVLPRIAANQFYDSIGNPITFEQSNGRMTARLVAQGETYFEGAKVEPLRLTQHQLEAFTGKYRSDELEVTYSLTVTDGKLAVAIGDKSPVELQPAAPNEFYSPDMGALVFTAVSGRHASGFAVYTQSARGMSFDRLDLSSPGR